MIFFASALIVNFEKNAGSDSINLRLCLPDLRHVLTSALQVSLNYVSNFGDLRVGRLLPVIIIVVFSSSIHSTVHTTHIRVPRRFLDDQQRVVKVV